MLDALFTPPVIASLVVSGCAAFGVSVVMRFLPDKRRLQTTLDRAEKALARVRGEIAGKQALIRQLQEEVAMLQPLHERLSDYHGQLTELNVEYERRQVRQDADRRREARDDELLGDRRRPSSR